MMNQSPGNQDRKRTAISAGISAILLLTAMACRGADSDTNVEPLIAKAQQAISANRLTTPAADNALAYIERALAADPGNPRAAALLNEVVSRYERLVDKVLDRGEQARLRSLDRAITFRDRANRIIMKHGLSNDPLANMDENIAALGQPTTDQASLATGDTDAMLNSLVEQHVALAGAFLAENNTAEARWHTSQADALAERYQLAARGLPELRQQLAIAEEASQGTVAEASTTTLEAEGTRERLTELAAFYVVSENAAMTEGDVYAAVSHRQAAKELIAQYGLSEDEIRDASAQLGQRKVARPTISRRIFGTF